MKRSNDILKLSREHHTALVLSLHISKASTPAMVGEMLKTLPEIFHKKLEPHFQEEETGLLPKLEAAGETGLVQRTLNEHHQLRSLIGRIESGDITCLHDFGVALAAHVRFEERELFAVAEPILSRIEMTPP
jgi:hemerythrin-like domain-containing protein